MMGGYRPTCPKCGQLADQQQSVNLCCHVWKTEIVDGRSMAVRVELPESVKDWLYQCWKCNLVTIDRGGGKWLDASAAGVGEWLMELIRERDELDAQHARFMAADADEDHRWEIPREPTGGYRVGYG